VWFWSGWILCRRKPTTTGQRPVACSLRSGRFSDPAFSIQMPPVNTLVEKADFNSKKNDY